MDEEVSLVGLGYPTAELCARAPGIGVDIGVGADDRFGLTKQRVGVGQRRARLGLVIEDESTLVHVRQKAGA